jgi:chromosome segregation protein
MYLKELKLHGFKSFADPTRLELEQGVTAIVGPNGCGKSNIADAIRWVLGEQSAKSLRAGAMQDVIFQGTSHRKPVNLCQVTLVFADCEQSLGVAYNEVEVSRKVVRDGGSEYSINGKSCRLKDIHNLFVDTGVGQVSYSFMLQGQIDQVLSSNPAERRAIFEEAAGISRYKSQRREALNKLAQVDANLARVSDVMEEVARQTGSLKRQAAKALRYQRINERLVRLDLAHHGYRAITLAGEGNELRRKSEVLKEALNKVSEELNHAEKGLSQKREQAQVLRTALESAQKAVYELRTEREAGANRSEMAKVRAKDLEKRLSAIDRELEELKQLEEEIANRLVGESAAKQKQLDLFGDSDEAFKKRSEALAEVQRALGVAESELSRSKQALLIKEGSVSRLRSNCTGLELDLKTYQVKHANLTEEMQGLRDEEAILSEELANLERARKAREADRLKQEERLSELKDKRHALLSTFKEGQASIQDADRKRASLSAQVTVLEGLQAKFEGFSEGAKAILNGKLSDILEPAQMALFLKQLRVDEGCTLAVETLMGPAVDGLFLSEAALLLDVSQAVQERKLGRASLLAPQAGVTESTPLVAELPAGARSVLSVVQSGDPAIQRFLEKYLGGCLIVDDMSAFLQYVAAHPEFVFDRAASIDGEFYDSSGLLLTGRTNSRKENGSFLARQNQIKKHRRELEAIQGDLERLRLAAEQQQGKLDGMEKRIEEQARLIAEIGTEITTLATQRTGVENRLKTARQTLENKTRDLQKLDATKEQSTTRLERARNELVATEADINSQKEGIVSAEEAVAARRQERENLREAFDQMRFDVAQKKQRLELLDRGLTELQRQSKEAQTTRTKRLEESKSIRAESKRLEEEAAAHDQSVKAVDLRLTELRRELDGNRSRFNELEKAIGVIEEGFAPKRESREKYAQELSKVDVAAARIDSRLQYLSEECARNYDKTPAEIDWQVEYWKAGESVPERIRVDIEDASPEEMEKIPEIADPTDEERATLTSVDWEEVEAEIAALRTRIQSMGPVNIDAIAEYRELKERHEFLKTQSEDLWKAKEQLLEAIDEINTTSKAMFAETFGRIRKNFHYTFDTLFGGGKADLELVDSEDVLESGIDITAQPPGTRLRTLGLLSGGQKTMTAVALLFAIYMVKPSPFCVLDEIDAPLDDANIGRFTGMLERFLEFSQFLIITHNKRTISVADTIYGATMQEKGVSRLVSMRFNKSTGKAEVSKEPEA